jgi:putative FmdB family regulatory protein
VPTYQYSCTDCGEPLEVVQKFTDEPLTTCPACGGRLRKVFSPVGVVFKGSGFYRTDSRAAGKPKDGKDSGAKESAPGSREAAKVPAGAGSSGSGQSGSGSGSSGSPGSATKRGAGAA